MLLSTLKKIKHIDFSWSEWIEEGVCDEVQTVLYKADGTPPIVENHDSLDFKIGGNANPVGPGVSYDDNPEELLDTIDMKHMRVLNIEIAGFQAHEYRVNGPSFLVYRGRHPLGGLLSNSPSRVMLHYKSSYVTY